MGTVIWEQLYGNNVERARHKLGIRKHNMSCCTSTCTQQSLPLGSSLQAYREETQTQAGLNSDKAELSNLRNPHSKTGIHGFESQWVNYSKITSPYYLFTESSIYSLCELNSKLYIGDKPVHITDYLCPMRSRRVYSLKLLPKDSIHSNGSIC